MTQKLWQKKLKLNYDKSVFDIVQFGSSVIEEKEARDVDIAVIFSSISVKEQLEKAQKIKRQLERVDDGRLHVSSFDLHSFFDEGNFSREGILFYGKSLISKKNFSIRFGLLPRVQIFYSLKKLDKKGKIRFHYMLRGRGGKYGLLRKYGGKLVNPGVIEVNPEFEKVFVESIMSFIRDNDFTIKKVLEVK